jgi:hypothetical protein
MYKMAKLNPLLILVGVLIVSFVFLSMASSQSYSPYEPSANHYSTYESMTYAEEHNEEEKEEEEYKENFESIVEEPRTVRYGPLRDSEIIDKFSQVKENGIEGKNGCVSSGLSNAGGYICLTPELIQLLKTRGGNASGVTK